MKNVENKTYIVKYFYSVPDTLKLIDDLANKYAFQIKDLAESLNGGTELQTCKNVWNWVRNNVQYVHDDHERELKGKKNLNEQVRRPLRTVEEGKGDCDCMTVLIRAILNHYPSIRHTSKATAYIKFNERGEKIIPDKNDYEHVYPIAYLSTGEVVAIDCVPESLYFGYEAPNIINQLIYPNIMALQELAGLGVQAEQLINEALKTNTENPIIENEDVHGFLGGLSINTEGNGEQYQLSGVLDQSIYADLIAQRNVLLAEKSINSPLAQSVDIDKEITIISNVINMFNVDINERINAILDAASSSVFKDYYNAILDQVNENQNDREMGNDSDVYIETGELGKINWSKVKNVVKTVVNPVRAVVKKVAPKLDAKVVKKTSKIVTTLKKINPAAVGIRAAALVVLKLNLFKLATKCYYGYMPLNEAQSKGLDIPEWQKFQASTKKLETFWVKVLGGDVATFKKNVTTGRAVKGAKLKGLDGLGEIASAATIAAASAFITAAASFFKGLKLKTLNPKEETDEDTEIPNLPPVSEDLQPTAENMEMDISSDGKTSSDPTSTNDGGWFQKNKKLIIWGSIGLAVLVIAIIVFIKLRKRKGVRGLGKRKIVKGRRKNLRGFVNSTVKKGALTSVNYVDITGKRRLNAYKHGRLANKTAKPKGIKISKDFTLLNPEVLKKRKTKKSGLRGLDGYVGTRYFPNKTNVYYTKNLKKVTGGAGSSRKRKSKTSPKQVISRVRQITSGKGGANNQGFIDFQNRLRACKKANPKWSHAQCMAYAKKG